MREAFDFPAPLVPVADGGKLSVLELFHGPTAAFKDFGARFLAASLTRIRKPGNADKPLNILVATSGDTGGAVAAAFHRRPGVVVSVLFPEGPGLADAGAAAHLLGRQRAVVPRQRHLRRLPAPGEAGVRRSGAPKERFELSSANSINLGRLLPQAVYYAATSLAVHRAHGVTPNFLIPSGNLGNSVACVWARKIGLPIGRIVLAHNANRAVPDFLRSGEWQPRASVPTLASAMDVGSPSNMERLRALFPDIDAVRGAVRAESVSDDEIRARIATDFRQFAGQYGKPWCPHTATAAEVHARLPDSERAAGAGCWSRPRIRRNFAKSWSRS